MTKRELVDMFKNIIFPKQAEDLLEINYEGLGELDKREYLRDTSILIMLAEKGLKSEQEHVLEKDGTLIVTTEHYKNVGRVLVQYGTNGTLFYQDQEPFMNKPCISSKACEHDKEVVLGKIRAEIEQNAYPIVHGVNNHEKGMTLYGVLQIIDKYKAESEETVEE